MQNPSPSAHAFELYSLRFDFSALGPFHFPPLLSANTFRGAFGLMLRRVSPNAYQEIFAPLAAAPAPSGLKNPPRPFVFRTRHLDGRAISPGESFHIHINLFQLDGSLLTTFSETLAEMANTGFGPERSRARLLPGSPPQLLSFPILPTASARQIQIDFLSPTELKLDNQIADPPLFPAILRRARDRISTLRALYGPGPLEIDFAALSARAAAVTLTRSEIHHVAASRHSSRTRQTHPLGGFVGFTQYAGALSEFLPFLEIATHTGIGRQTVWGKGEIAARILA